MENDQAITVKRALVSHLLEQWGPVEELRGRLRKREVTRAALRESARQQLSTAIACAHRERVIDLALDELESERLCPEIDLPTHPRRLPDVPVHALVFSAFPHAANELYPLLVDAYVAKLSADGDGFLTVGVHETWLVDGSFRRALLFNEEDQGLVEADIENRLKIRSIQVLALDLREEHAAHRRIETALPNAYRVNPFAGTARLDDKCWTGTCWIQAGLPTPRFLAIQPGIDRGSVEAFAASSATLVLKPIDGTEGRGVRIAPRGTLLADLPPHAENLLLLEERGVVRYMSDGGPVRCTIRLNVCWDGMRAYAESGYAQVAADADGIASAGCGGHIVSLPALWSRLCRADGALLAPSRADLQHLLSVANEGAAVLARELGDVMPGLVGIDLLLDDHADGSLQPILLEANGRPSGMCHSRYLTADGPGDEPGVTARLWARVTEHSL